MITVHGPAGMELIQPPLVTSLLQEIVKSMENAVAIFAKMENASVMPVAPALMLANVSVVSYAKMEFVKTNQKSAALAKQQKIVWIIWFVPAVHVWES